MNLIMKVQITPNKKIFNYCAPYIIAEIGANHNGDIDLAINMINAAYAAGCHAVKFQSWTPDSLVSEQEYENNQVYNDSPKKHFGSLREMVNKYYLRPEQHFELKKHCDTIGIDFLSTPFSEKEADLLNEIDIPFFKVASMDINNYRLLKYLAEFQKPIVLSTGMSTISEIDKAIKVVESAGNFNIVLLHCISIYPPKYEDIHLNNIHMLNETFGYPVGFSDHTIGFSIPLAAIAKGACIVEKHFTIDNNLPGWDHEISADSNEMRVICSEGVNISKALGEKTRTVSIQEEEKKIKFRRSAVASRNLKKGKIIDENDILYKRPGSGLSPDLEFLIIGRKLNRDINKDVLFSIDNFE